MWINSQSNVFFIILKRILSPIKKKLVTQFIFFLANIFCHDEWVNDFSFPIRILFSSEILIQRIYYVNRIPDSPAEPDIESHPTTDPKIIPLEDITGNADSVSDFTNIPWPEPKPALIPSSPPPTQTLPPATGAVGFPPGYSTVGNFPGFPQMGMPGVMPTGTGTWRVRISFVLITNFAKEYYYGSHIYFCYLVLMMHHVLNIINKYFESTVRCLFFPSFFFIK